MKVFLVPLICLWLIVAPACAQYTFYFPTLDIYSRSVTGLRELVKLKEKKQEVTCHGKPMLDRQNKFILVQLISSVTITLTVHQDTLYVEGYSDRLPDGSCRSFIFKDPKAGAESSLCQGEKKPVREKLSYSSQYSKVEGEAGERGDVEIGIRPLETYMTKIYGQQRPAKDTQAQFILAAVQMVSEAVRFSYIQRQCFQNPQFKPNPRFVSLEEEWGHISDAFETANADGTFLKANIDKIKLKDDSGKAWKVTKVSEIEAYIALLNKVSTSKCKVRATELLLDQLIMSY